MRGPMDVVQQGTGFAVPGQLVLTCEHVRRAARREQQGTPGSVLVICPHDGGGENLDWRRAWEVDVLAYTDAPWVGRTVAEPTDSPAVAVVDNDVSSRNADVAALRVRRWLMTGEDAEVAFAGMPVFQEGAHGWRDLRWPQKLYVLGFPTGRQFGLTPTPTTGDFAGVHSDEHGWWIKLQGLISPGHSGGPVITTDGKVVAWNVRNDILPRMALEDVRGISGLNHVRPIEFARACYETAVRRREELRLSELSEQLEDVP